MNDGLPGRSGYIGEAQSPTPQTQRTVVGEPVFFPPMSRMGYALARLRYALRWPR